MGAYIIYQVCKDKKHLSKLIDKDSLFEKAGDLFEFVEDDVEMPDAVENSIPEAGGLIEGLYDHYTMPYQAVQSLLTRYREEKLIMYKNHSASKSKVYERWLKTGETKDLRDAVYWLKAIIDDEAACYFYDMECRILMTEDQAMRGYFSEVCPKEKVYIAGVLRGNL